MIWLNSHMTIWKLSKGSDTVYKVIDTYDGFEDIIGTFDTFDEARAAAKQHCEDTDGECQVSIFAKTRKGYKVVI